MVKSENCILLRHFFESVTRGNYYPCQYTAYFHDNLNPKLILLENWKRNLKSTRIENGEKQIFKLEGTQRSKFKKSQKNHWGRKENFYKNLIMILTSWNPKISRGTTLALMGALFLGMIMQLSVLAQEAQVEVRDEESYRM